MRRINWRRSFIEFRDLRALDNVWFLQRNWLTDWLTDGHARNSSSISIDGAPFHPLSDDLHTSTQEEFVLMKSVFFLFFPTFVTSHKHDLGRLYCKLVCFIVTLILFYACLYNIYFNRTNISNYYAIILHIVHKLNVWEYFAQHTKAHNLRSINRENGNYPWSNAYINQWCLVENCSSNCTICVTK